MNNFLAGIGFTFYSYLRCLAAKTETNQIFSYWIKCFICGFFVFLVCPIPRTLEICQCKEDQPDLPQDADSRKRWATDYYNYLKVKATTAAAEYFHPVPSSDSKYESDRLNTLIGYHDTVILCFQQAVSGSVNPDDIDLPKSPSVDGPFDDEIPNYKEHIFIAQRIIDTLESADEMCTQDSCLQNVIAMIEVWSNEYQFDIGTKVRPVTPAPPQPVRVPKKNKWTPTQPWNSSTNLASKQAKKPKK